MAFSVGNFQLPDFPLFEEMGESRSGQTSSSTAIQDDSTHNAAVKPIPDSQDTKDGSNSLFETSIEQPYSQDHYSAIQENFFAYSPPQPVEHSDLVPSEGLEVPGYPQVRFYSNPSLGEYYQLGNSIFKPLKQFYPHTLQPVEPEYQPAHASFRYMDTPYPTSFSESPHTYKLKPINATQDSHTHKKEIQYPHPSTEKQTSHTDEEDLPQPHTPIETPSSLAPHHIPVTSAEVSAQYHAANSPYRNRPRQIRDLSGFTSPDPAYINCQVGEPCYPAPLKIPYCAKTTQELLTHMRDWHNIHPKEEMAGTCRRCKCKWYFNWDRERHYESEAHVEAVWRKAAGPSIYSKGKGKGVKGGGESVSGGGVYIPGHDFFARGPEGYKEREQVQKEREHIEKMRKRMTIEAENSGGRKRIRV
ncbi:hypothetical protein GLAREA_04076 [Glarea lozoyensis ATCC 20868]|uniref:Uncharacterized protein n=1 Tax=Glarea lozoyensis (strain ATCC 20868 / MF5171) TaxID=1116229 RepID=S3D1R5_GLAL2|nr:uncharacterized protein GLAREA_04076 [Glarea lozoyensis ATCC 20868]EPE31109.1 hypothetical protein GLAREA_04076 [Glarea lozoyensis ATCC 20868]